jgi:hypothetical protein
MFMTVFKQAQNGFIAIRVAHANNPLISHRASNGACVAALLDTDVGPAHRARLIKSMGLEVREIEQVKRDDVFVHTSSGVFAAERGAPGMRSSEGA